MAEQPGEPGASVERPKRAREPRAAAKQSAGAAKAVHAPPAQVTAEGVEPHPHRTGKVKLDLVIAGAAIFLSVLSLLIAIKHGMIMRDLVSANSWPLLQYTTSNTDEQQKLSIDLRVQNAGVGPAIVKRFTVHYRGRVYTEPYRLLRDCCGYVVPGTDTASFVPGVPIVGAVEGTVIRAGESAGYLVMDLAETNADVWRRLDQARFQLRFDACYCSVLGECWTSDLTGVEPEQVEQCAALATGDRD